MTSSDQAQRAFVLLEQALDLPPDQRPAFVQDACAGDEAVRHHLEALLAADAAFQDEEPLPSAFHPPHTASLLGQQIGPYTITSEIGAGGMGTVYLARRADLDKQVALKLIRDGRRATPHSQKRFLFERRILARLQHPNIARLLDAGVTEEGLPFFAMEYVEGTSITAYCQTRRLTIDERLALFLQVCKAVQYAHHNLIIHRDLKPSNVLVSNDGTVSLLDFGIAKLLEEDDEGDVLTHTGVRLMTPEYASPEQVRGEPVTMASDVYGLGVLLYELLTDHHPYPLEGRSLQEIERIVGEKMPERPSSVVTRARQLRTPDGVPQTITPAAIGAARRIGTDKLRRRLKGDLDTIVLMALRKEPQRRYASAEQLLDDIGRHRDNVPVKARKDTTGYRIQKFVKRHRIGVAMAACLALVLLGLSIRERSLRSDAEQARDLARIEAEKAERVAGFLADLFKGSDPSIAQGRDITVREVMDRGARQVETALEDEPEIQAMLMTVLGIVYQNIGQYEAAETMLAGALKRRQALWTHGAHEQVSESLSNLGLLRRQQGDFAAAESLYQQAMVIDRTLHGYVHPSNAHDLNNMADLFAAQGDFAQAESLYQEALDVYRTLYGDQHTDIAMTLQNLAVLYTDQGKPEVAEPMLREALAMDRSLLGDEHPDTVLILRNLAASLVRQGNHEAAGPLFREILDLQRSLYGDNHPLIAASLDGLATVAYFQGNYAETERLLLEALAMKRTFFSDDHPDIDQSLKTLTLIYNAWGQPERAAFYQMQRLVSRNP